MALGGVLNQMSFPMQAEGMARSKSGRSERALFDYCLFGLALLGCKG